MTDVRKTPGADCRHERRLKDGKGNDQRQTEAKK
jgi:hypothetical protein